MTPHRTGITTPPIRGRRAAEVLPEVDVAEIAASVYDFLSATRRLMERPNQKLSVSQSEIEVLQFIAHHPGCGVSDIARLRFLRASNVSATVRRLINAGLVTRQANDLDRRAQDLFLSDDGIEVMNQVTDEWAMLIAGATRRMDARDIAKLRRGVPALRNLSMAAESLVDDMQRRQDYSLD
ncbi:MarR family winged helix-turn-helix transcriptional regulator [Corynebacterium heidelbergense]|uniref:MarR family transcriptional regulator n=1 Tax=Corynebacterium heidelbergense TaxID=2055947 RepID=A0A364V6M8_9CORY|nr:MarR family winged helix-turn-helix transcriptional regulator [Corynebacterium heidelbergense]RAV32305.1 MarR family transcriptional regulator [Corynebacterium heidelbergense]RAV34187.1 MarR family transcriptional regulator [Corynebacterium heidelbergense]WCZ35851.1 MarR family protein [Corynebacterium heidelbergense]